MWYLLISTALSRSQYKTCMTKTIHYCQAGVRKLLVIDSSRSSLNGQMQC